MENLRTAKQKKKKNNDKDFLQKYDLGKLKKEFEESSYHPTRFNSPDNTSFLTSKKEFLFSRRLTQNNTKLKNEIKKPSYISQRTKQKVDERRKFFNRGYDVNTKEDKDSISLKDIEKKMTLIRDFRYRKKLF